MRCLRDLVSVKPCLVTVLSSSFEAAMAVELIDVSVVKAREPGVLDPLFEYCSRALVPSAIAEVELDGVHYGVGVS